MLIHNPNIRVIMVLASIDCLFSFKLKFPWFLVWWVICDYSLDILVSRYWTLCRSFVALGLIYNWQVTWKLLFNMARRGWESRFPIRPCGHHSLGVWWWVLHYFWLGVKRKIRLSTRPSLILLWLECLLISFYVAFSGVWGKVGVALVYLWAVIKVLNLH